MEQKNVWQDQRPYCAHPRLGGFPIPPPPTQPLKFLCSPTVRALWALAASLCAGVTMPLLRRVQSGLRDALLRGPDILVRPGLSGCLAVTFDQVCFQNQPPASRFGSPRLDWKRATRGRRAYDHIARPEFYFLNDDGYSSSQPRSITRMNRKKRKDDEEIHFTEYILVHLKAHAVYAGSTEY